MAMMHKCGRCGEEFRVSRETLLPTGWGRRAWQLQLRDRVSFDKSLDDYSKVRCPICGRIESDGRIKVLGIFRARTFVGLVVGIVFALALYAVIDNLKPFTN
jgi:hypothetical protein